MKKDFQLAEESTVVSGRSIANNICGVVLESDTTLANRVLSVENDGGKVRFSWNHERLSFDAKLIEAFDIVSLYNLGERFLAATITFSSNSESLRYSFVVIHESHETWLRKLAEEIGEVIGHPPADLVGNV